MHLNRAVKIALVIVLAAIPIAMVSVRGNVENDNWPRSQLSPSDENRARSLAEKELAIQPDERIYFTRVQLLPGSEAATTGREVIVTHYRYQGNEAILTYVDLDSETVFKVEKVVNMPTPLAKEERDLAIELARADSSLAELIESYGSDLHIETRLAWPERIAEPSEPHRAVHLLFRIGRSYLSGPQVVVDLVNETVRVQPALNNS